LTTLLVRNPASGSAEEATEEKVEEILSSDGRLRVIEPGSAETFAEELLGALRDVNRVVVAGGDGTMNLAVNALRDRLGDLTFGLIPAGTGNDLARTLDLPDDPIRAAETVLDGRKVPLDVGRVVGAGVDRLFTNACMGGFPVQVDRSIDEKTKKWLGPFAFWVAGIKAAADLQRFDVTVDGRTIEDCVAAGVGNGRTCGGGVEVWPQADPSDGLLDLCVLPAETVRSALTLLRKVKVGDHVDLPEVEYIRSASIEVKASPETEFNIDGEIVGLRTPMSFEVFGDLRITVT
jgi:diacylglycerol kinase (ATP)